jgi:hypothetical protein
MEVRKREHAAEIEDVYRRRYGKFLRVAVAILRDEQLGEEAVNVRRACISSRPQTRWRRRRDVDVPSRRSHRT